jgi:hypothetical protein
MSGTISEMVEKGTTRKKIVKVLVEKYGRTEEAAEAKITAHLAHMKGNKGLNVIEADGNLSIKS